MVLPSPLIQITLIYEYGFQNCSGINYTEPKFYQCQSLDIRSSTHCCEYQLGKIDRNLNLDTCFPMSDFQNYTSMRVRCESRDLVTNIQFIIMILSILFLIVLLVSGYYCRNYISPIPEYKKKLEEQKRTETQRLVITRGNTTN